MIRHKLTALVRTLQTTIVAAVLTAAGSVQGANFFDNSIVVSGTGGGVVDLNTASGSNLPGRYTWAIFALQGGVTITDPTYTGVPDVLGNVGIAQAGTITMSNSTVNGALSLRTGAVPSVPGPATITGGITQNAPTDTILNTAQANAYNAASAAASLASKVTDGAGNLTLSGPFPNPPTLVDGSFADTGSIAFNNTSGTINGAAGGTYVLNLANLVLSASTLTITGDATTNYIINVSKFMTLSNNSHIVLSGGIQPQNVLFNVRNSYGYDVTMSGGSTLDGIILAANRNVKLTGTSVVTGEVIARGVSLSGNSKVINPVASP